MQELLVQFLILDDGMEKEREHQRQMRLALFAAGRLSVAMAFPELGLPDEGAPEAMPSQGADLSGLKWASPGEAGVAADMDLLTRTMRDNEVITVRAAPARVPGSVEHDLEWP